jgi:branched-chain amino acid transport system ATP-binding protein
VTQPLLSLHDVNTFSGESHILHGLTFEVFPGEVIGILGRNGVGKTTTLQSVLGIPSPRSGEIRLSGDVISGLPTYEIVARGVGWVPQGHRIFPTLTVVENLDLALARAHPGRWNLDAVYEAFPRLQTRRAARGGSLSGGEQQMLAIARALIQNPDIFLMDEPSEGLSPLIVSEVGSLIRKLNTEGHTFLIVEQNLSFALSVAHRILIMNKGAIVYSGKPDDIRNDPEIGHRFLGMGVTDIEQGPPKGVAE